MTTTHHITAGALIAVGAAGCFYHPPELTGGDQVHDYNVEATVQKDSGLAAQSWPWVDNYVVNTMMGGSSGPGCAIGIARGGHLLYLQGYGKAELGGANWSVGTVAAVGSVSKTFTAAAALRMHELELIDIDLDVADYLPGDNAALGSTPIFRLLNHRSGVGGGTKGSAFSPAWLDGTAQSQLLARPAVAFELYEANETVADLADGDPEEDVLPQGVYSNVGYSVAGAVIDAAAADTPSGGYEAWIWDNIGHHADWLDDDNLLTLALTHSWRDGDIPGRAVGYQPDGAGGWDEFEAWNDTAGLEGWEGPSGGWAMTIGDLTRFAVELNTGQIVSTDMRDLMRTPMANVDEISNDYGLGTLLGDTDAGQPPYWHGGIIGGHTAAWTWWPSYGGQSLAIAMICNRNDLDPFSLRDHASLIASVVPGGGPVPLALPALPGVSPSALDGRTFALDASAAWQARPAGAFVPLAALAHTLLISAQVDAGRVRFVLAEGTVDRGRAEPVPGRQPVSLGEINLSANPSFATRPADVRLETMIGELPVRDLVIRGALDGKGSALSRMSLTAVLDARDAAPLVHTSATALCADVVAAGAACAPCRDGAPTCVRFEYRGLTGRDMVRTASP